MAMGGSLLENHDIFRRNGGKEFPLFTRLHETGVQLKRLQLCSCDSRRETVLSHLSEIDPLTEPDRDRVASAGLCVHSPTFRSDGKRHRVTRLQRGENS